MLDFEDMRWERGSDVLLEVGRVPVTWPAGRSMGWRSSCAFVLRSPDGTRRTGLPNRATQPEAYPGDVVTLVDVGRFEVDVVVPDVDGARVELPLRLWVSDPEALAAQFASEGR